MSDGTLPKPAAAPSAAAPATWKLHLAAAIGAFFLGVTDHMRHADGSTAGLLNKLVVDDPSAANFTPIILLLIPLLGVIAAWIFKPITEREAFALGFAVFSVFALAPEKETPNGKGTIGTAFNRESGPTLIGRAFAEGPAASEGGATVYLYFEHASSPPDAEVSVKNMTSGQRFGTFQVENRLMLVGKAGDSIQVVIEAPGYERTVADVTLQQESGVYSVQVQESGTPLFIQRLTPAARVAATPSGAAADPDFIDSAMTPQ